MAFRIVFLLTFFCLTNLFSQTITVAVASNVSYAINELVKEFTSVHPKSKVRVIVGSSGKLTAQITNNAPFDIFMSANMLYPNRLYADNLTLQKPKVYAKGALALLHVRKKKFDSLKEFLLHVEKIAIANPKTAPYGKASFEVLKNLNILQDIQSKIIYGESISQTLAYTLNVTKIGFIAKSALFSPKLKIYKKNEDWSDIDAKLYTPIEQGLVLLKHAKNNNTANIFYDFILSKKGQKIFKDFGYTTSCTN